MHNHATDNTDYAYLCVGRYSPTADGLGVRSCSVCHSVHGRVYPSSSSAAAAPQLVIRVPPRTGADTKRAHPHNYIMVMLI